MIVEVVVPECRVVFENRLPDFWNSKITHIAAQFYYKKPDETDLEIYSVEKPVSLTTNQTDQLNSNNAAMCVGKVFAAVAVSVPGRPDGKATKMSPNVPNECTTEIRIVLHATAAAASAKRIEDLIPDDAYFLEIS
jgi:hypothetical protein